MQIHLYWIIIYLDLKVTVVQVLVKWNYLKEICDVHDWKNSYIIIKKIDVIMKNLLVNRSMKHEVFVSARTMNL